MKISLNLSGKIFESQGETVEEALEGFNLGWEQIKMKGIMTISSGRASYEHLFQPKVLRRVFANKITRMVWAKRLTLLLNETNE